jgi:hypothetical protein
MCSLIFFFQMHTPPRFLTLAAVLGLAASPLPADFVDSTAVNLVHWPEASLTGSTEVNVEALQDRTSTTPWITHRFSPNQWLRLDIGKEQKEINRVRFTVNRYPVPDFASIRPASVRVYVGNDGEDMTANKLVFEIDHNEDWLVDKTFDPVPGRYVWVDFGGSETVKNCEISGLSVYSRDPKPAHPKYPVNEARSGGARVEPLSGWWHAVTSRGGANLISEHRLGNVRHIDDQPVMITVADEDASVRIEMNKPYDVDSIVIGSSPKLGSYATPHLVRLAASSDGRNYHELGEFPYDDQKDSLEIPRPAQNAAAWDGVKYLKVTLPRNAEKPARNLSRVLVFGKASSKVPTSAPVVPEGSRAVGEVDLPEGARLSAALFDDQGNLIRTLHALEPLPAGKQTLFWDGKNTFGQEMPAGDYVLRTLASSIRVEPLPAIGNSARPMSEKNSASTWATDFAFDKDGNYYQVASFDEAGKAVRQYLKDGTPGWSFNWNGSFGIAADDDHVYVLAADIGGAERGQRILRLNRKTGLLDKFPDLEKGAILVNKPEPLPTFEEGRRTFTDEQERWIVGTWGIAVDKDSLWVTNYRENSVDRYDKVTGEKKGSFPVQAPLGIDVMADGSLWVANRGDRITQFTPEGKVIKEVTGLSLPWGVATGPNNTILITEKGTGRVILFDGTTGREVWSRGRAATAGLVGDDTFRWPGSSAVAVDSEGGYLVTDAGNQRAQRFHADGTLRESIKADFGQPGPSSNPAVDCEKILSGHFQYKVDLDTGDWKFTHNWKPEDGAFAAGASFPRRLSNGRDYIYYLNTASWGLSAYLLDPEGKGARRSSILGRHWTGTDDQLAHNWKVQQFEWTDKNGNGTVEEEEVHFTDKDLGYFTTYSWIDEQGAMWFVNLDTKQVEKLEIQGFDEHQNPIYRWDQRTVVVPHSEFPKSGGWNLVRPTPSGEMVFLSGDTDESRAFWKNNGLYHAGGFSIARFHKDGRFAGIFQVPTQMASFTVDDDFVYLAQNPNPQCVSVMTHDGLLAAQLIPGKESGWAPGWMDTTTPLTAFKVPGTDIHHVVAEEVFYSQLLHYRFKAGEKELKRTETKISWEPAAPVAAAQ